MRIDAGILPDSVRFFHEPDAFTEQALYHTPHVGVYHCDSQYNFPAQEKPVWTSVRQSLSITVL